MDAILKEVTLYSSADLFESGVLITYSLLYVIKSARSGLRSLVDRRVDTSPWS